VTLTETVALGPTVVGVTVKSALAPAAKDSVTAAASVLATVVVRVWALSPGVPNVSVGGVNVTVIGASRYS
jgi:hypothetical protein